MPPPPTTPGAPGPQAGHVGWALAGLSLSMLLASLGISVANVALPTLTQAFGASFQAVQWVVLAYLLTVTTLVVSAGRLGDVLGGRRLLVAGVATFTMASAACALAPGLWALVAARAVQGLGAAVMMALSMAFAAQAVPAARTGSAMGLLGTASAIGTALGPSLGGLLIGAAGWRAVFLVNVPLGLAALLIVRRHLPAARGPAAGRAGLDPAGTVLLALTLAAYALAMTTGHGRLTPLTVALLAAAAGGAALFLAAEARAAAPLVRPAALRDPVLGGGLAMSALVSAVVMATLVVGPFHLARALGLSAPAVGLVMSVGPLVVVATGVPAGRLADRLGGRRMTVAGLVLMAAGAALLCAAPARLGVPGYLVPLVVTTLGYALFQTANTTVVMGAARPERRGVTSGMLNLARNLGLITGASVMGAVFAGASGAADVATADPGAVATGTRVTFALAVVLVLVALGLAVGGLRRVPPVAEGGAV